MFLRGCSLRCRFCYRPDELKARGRTECSPQRVAALLDQSATEGAESWQFLGGNPDESLPGILAALLCVQKARPVVWNSALMLTEPAMRLLFGVVDIWLPDWKFGNDSCAQEIANVSNYLQTIRRNLTLLADQTHVLVRHMTSPRHDQCCSTIIRHEVRQLSRDLHEFPENGIVRFDQPIDVHDLSLIHI